MGRVPGLCDAMAHFGQFVLYHAIQVVLSNQLVHLRLQIDQGAVFGLSNRVALHQQLINRKKLPGLVQHALGQALAMGGGLICCTHRYFGVVNPQFGLFTSGHPGTDQR